MRLVFYLIIGGIVALIGFVWFLLSAAYAEHKTKKNFKRAVEQERDDRNEVWSEAQTVTDLVNTYMAVVCKHGADSEEAKQFRFCTDSPTMRERHDDAALQAFNQQCDLIDETYRKFKSRR